MTRPAATHVFPPALAPVLRERVAHRAHDLADVADDTLVELLSTVFFAGIETDEGERRVNRVVFMGTSQVDLVLPEGSRGGPLYTWKVLPFVTPRPFTVAELVKLAVASADETLYTAVRVTPAGELTIAGLAREGFTPDTDPFIKVVATRPGCLSLRSGRHRLLDYERGTIVVGGDDVLVADGSVRRSLEACAAAAGIEEESLADYLEAVRSLVLAMAAHGRGGILVVSADAAVDVTHTAYRMASESSIATLLRLARRIRHGDDASSYGFLLRNAFVSETGHMIDEIGGLTAVDGATILDRSLAIIAFGVVLPVGGVQAVTCAGPVDLAARGTRHRAAALYAAEHPGSVVFVASEDGQLSCMQRESSEAVVRVWSLGAPSGRSL